MSKTNENGLPFDVRKAVVQDINASIAFLSMIRDDKKLLELLQDNAEKKVKEMIAKSKKAEKDGVI